MKKVFIIINLLLSLCWTGSAQAQKAYELIRYKGSIQGNRTTLLLADGYLPASKVTIYSKHGNQLFSPSTDGPDSQGELRFNAAASNKGNKKSAGSWLVLKGLDKYPYPSQIRAVYWDTKVRRAVVLRQVN